jgi:hypothetical protein
MTAVENASGGDSADEDLPDNRLFDLYRDLIGEPDGEVDVYLGFGLFFGGVALALGAMVLFLYGIATTTPDTDPYFTLVKPAFAMGMLAVPVATSGIVVLLPIDKRAVVATGGGDLLIVLAVLLFWGAYPDNWSAFNAGQTAGVLALYALGLTLVVGSTGAALVAEQIQQANAPGPTDIQPMAEDEDASGESYSDDDIRADIDEAMKDVELSWGGVEKTEGKRLSFDTDEELDASGFQQTPAKTTRSSGVDTQLSALKGLKGGNKKTATSESTVDDQTAKLNELRKQREEDEQKQAESGGASGRSGGGLLAWLRGLLS